MTISPPIIVEDKSGPDLAIYRSKEDAERALEATDVTNEEYRAFDGEGRLLVLEVVRRKRPILGGFARVNVDLVHIREAEAEPLHAEDLRSVLIRYISCLRTVEKSDADAPIDQLIAKVTALQSSKRRDPYGCP